ncbi:MAG: transitional endoplasmic reticulum ATPase [Solirubrobacteraceae bacterium]|nr:transitional endoplasmic reticulum ATPase [Solirubrobacteraceae bacterium]
MGGASFWSAIAILVLVVAYVGLLVASIPHVSGDRLSMTGLLNLAGRGRVQNALFLDHDAYIVGKYRRADGTTASYNASYPDNSVVQDRLVGVLLGDGVNTDTNHQALKGFTTPATALFPVLILIVVFVYFIRSYQKGTGMFAVGTGARRRREDDIRVSFDDVAGQEAAVAELREVADFLADTDRFTALGATIPRGILLYGPPGCGKTLLARALAGQAGAAFYSISGSDFVELYVGVGAARVRKLFQEARLDAPAIIFIDELDAIGRRRAAAGPASTASADEQGQALNQLLAEIDGFTPSDGVMLVGATNRPDVIDPALLRPGRFDRAVGLELPDERGRREILEVHARTRPMSADVDLDPIAHQAVGMTGADLAGLMNEAALLAARRNSSTISADDLEHAMRRISEAPERQRRLAVRDRRIGQSFLAAERVTFADVAGLGDAVGELSEVREYLGDPARFERMGARIPTGYLLSGLPGSGKTLLARALAGETNATFIAAAGTEFVETFSGEGAARVRDLFAQARSVAPAIIFIDELDAIGGHRVASGHNAEQAHTLNQLLIELDGFRGRTGVVVMAATNRPDMLDSALTRPGRFDRSITLEMPDLVARGQILALHAKGKPLAANVDLEALARVTRGLSGADLANLLNEGALIATRKHRTEIDQDLLEEALDRTGVGIAGTHALSDEDRRTIAYHEAGHGIVALALPGGRLLHKISIVPRGSVVGVTWMPEADDQLLHRRAVLIERMATLLGGRVAEELVFGEPSDGAGNDLAEVAGLARSMIMNFGMSRALGALAYPAENGSSPYSLETARLIDSEARRLVDEAERLAGEVLTRSRGELDLVAAALLERETLSLAEVEALIGSAPVLTDGRGL